jgi:hypothetical protein
VLSVLAQAINDGTLENIVADSAFVSKIKCCVGGNTANFAFITSAKYNELEAAGTLDEKTLYFITDDGTLNNLEEYVNSLTDKINKIVNGQQVVGKATDVEKLNGLTVTKSDARVMLKGTVDSVQIIIKDKVAADSDFTGNDIYKFTTFDTLQVGDEVYYQNEKGIIRSALLLNKRISIPSGGAMAAQANNGAITCKLERALEIPSYNEYRRVAGKADNLYQEENGVLKYGGLVIPQKKLVWEYNSLFEKNYADMGYPDVIYVDNAKLSISESLGLTLNESLNEGDVFEVCFITTENNKGLTNGYLRVRGCLARLWTQGINTTDTHYECNIEINKDYIIEAVYYVDSQMLYLKTAASFPTSTTTTLSVRRIYKIVE